MPKLMWVVIAGVLVGERWGLAGALLMGAADLAWAYLKGFYEAWEADRQRTIKESTC